MTVKELCNLIPEDNKVKFAISGNLYKFIHTDPFQIAIYGDYEIQAVYGNGEKEIEIELKMQLVKAHS